MLSYSSKPTIAPVLPAPSRSLSKVQVQAGNKWILMGTSGAGKTTALKYLDAAYRGLFPGMRHYLLDSKHDGDFDRWPGVIRQDKAPGMPGKRERYQVWQPMTIYPNEVETWLDRIFHNGPGIVMIDELYHLCYSRNEYSHNYDIIVKMGRSLKIGVITLTQELSKIPQNAFTQSDHRLGFYLEGRYNKMIRNDMLKFEVDQPKDQFGFWYQHKNGRGEPPYFKDIQSFLGVSGASR